MKRGQPRRRASIHRLSKTIALKMLTLGWLASSLAGQQPTKEYIRLGDRVVAVENPAPTYAIAVSASPTSVGSADSVQVTATITPTCASCTVVWNSSNQGSFSSSGTAQTATFNPPAVTAQTPVTITASTLSGSIVSQPVTIQVFPVLTPQSQSFGSSGGSGSVTVVKQGAWTATSNAAGNANCSPTSDSWLQITSSPGVSPVTYSVAENYCAGVLTGTLTIAGSTFVVNQSAAVQGLGITSSTPTISGVPDASGNINGSFTVTSTGSASWCVVSYPSFLVIPSNETALLNCNSPQTGGGTYTFSANPNASTSSQSGNLCIASGTCVTITQTGGISLSGSQTASYGGASGSVTVSDPTSSTWYASVPSSCNCSWLEISGSSSGSASSSSLDWLATPNTGTGSRSGYILIGGQQFNITQAGNSSLTISPQNPMVTSAHPNPPLSFTAYYGGSSVSATWSVQGVGLPTNQGYGTINASGQYTPPSTLDAGPFVDVIKATYAGSSITTSVNLEYETPGGSYLSPQWSPYALPSNVPQNFEFFALTIPGWRSKIQSGAYYATEVLITTNSGGSWPAATNSCLVDLNLDSGGSIGVTLADNNGNLSTGQFGTIPQQSSVSWSGGSGLIWNSQCEISFVNATASDTGAGSNEELTVYLPIWFRAGWGAAQTASQSVYVQAQNPYTSSYTIAPTQFGSWMSPGYGPPGVAISSTSPTSGSGTVNLIGWALDSPTLNPLPSPETPIQSVLVLIDGIAQPGSAALRQANPPDIPSPNPCSQVPSQAGVTPASWDCPNFGWTYALNTTQLSNGTHSITARATDTDTPSPHVTTSAPVTFTVNNSISITSVTASPSTLNVNQSATLSAVVTGTTNQSVSWSKGSSAPGTLNGNIYTAPSGITSQQTVVLTATSLATSSVTATVSVTLQPVSVSVQPQTTSPLSPNQTQLFTATVGGTSNQGLTWRVSPNLGSLTTQTTSSGTTNTYTAPANIATQTTITLTVTSVVDVTMSATAQISLMPSSGGSGPPWYSGWTYRKPITIFSGQVAGALSTFPVLISIPSDSNLASSAQSNGNDILFTDSSGTNKLNHEIETYTSSTGQLNAWVSVPSLSSTTNTIIYMYYGNSSASNQQNPSSAWDSNYVAVYHFPSGSTLSANDSSANGNNGTISGATATGGQIGGAASFNGSSSIEADGVASGIQATNLTYSLWVNFPTTYTSGGAAMMVIRNGDDPSNNDFDLGFGSTWDGIGSPGAVYTGYYTGSGWSGIYSPQTSWTANTWYYVVGTYSATGTLTLYVNGTQVSSEASTPRGATPYAAHFGIGSDDNGSNDGNYDFTGSLDEVRISNTVRSAAWIATEYNNQHSPASFFSVGSQQTSSGGSGTVGIIVTSSPSGLSLTVDGSACTAPCSESWTAGSSHTIAVTTTPQAGATGTQYVYSGWSDSLAQSHVITVPASATTYTATFTTQFYLTTAANPSADGSIAPASGWFNSGASVSVSATSNSGYAFTGFSGALSGTTSPQTLAMNAPANVTAVFGSQIPVTVTSLPTGLALSVDSAACTSPCSFQWTIGSTHTVAANTSPQAGASGTQYVYATWSDGGMQSHSVTAPMAAITYTATFTTQYYLTTTASPSSEGSISPTTGWFNAGSVVPVSATADSGYEFTGFSGALSGTGSPQNLTVTAAATVTASFGSSSGWYNAGGTWTNRKSITINHAQVSGSSNLTSFPMLFSVTDDNLRTVANGGEVGESNGGDILFTLGDGVTKLNHELESYSPTTGQVIAWVEIPTVSPTADTPLFIYFGNSSASNQQNATGVWSGGYQGVWHLPNGSTLSANDSTSDADNGAITGAAAAAGFIGGGASFNGSSNYINMGTSSSLGVTGTITLSAWVQVAAFPTSGNYGIIAEKGYDSSHEAYFLRLDYGTTGNLLLATGSYTASGNVNHWTNWPISNWTLGSWHYVTGVYDGSYWRIYLDGSQEASTADSTGAQASSEPFTVGAGNIAGTMQRWFDGVLDEVRVSATAHTPAWIATEYNNQNSPSTFYFYTLPISVSPATATLSASQTQQFTASVTFSSNTAVNWSISPSVGSINSSGLYTAPSSIGSQQNVTVTATSQANSTMTASALITLQPQINVTVSPASATLYESQTQQFTANTSVTWSASLGSITSSGLYTAPSSITSQETVTITATSTANTSISGTAQVTLLPPISVTVSPSTATISLGQTAQFSASVANTTNSGVTWSTTLGTVSSTGLYTPPLGAANGGGTYVIATSVVDTTKFGYGTVTINPPSPPSVSGSLPGGNVVGTFYSYSISANVTGTLQRLDFWVPGVNQSDYSCRVEYDPSSNQIMVGTTDNDGNDIWGGSATPGTSGAVYAGYACQVDIGSSSVQTANGTTTLQLSMAYGSDGGYFLNPAQFYASALDYSQLGNQATFLGQMMFYEPH